MSSQFEMKLYLFKSSSRKLKSKVNSTFIEMLISALLSCFFFTLYPSVIFSLPLTVYNFKDFA